MSKIGHYKVLGYTSLGVNGDICPRGSLCRGHCARGIYICLLSKCPVVTIGVSPVSNVYVM